MAGFRSIAPPNADIFEQIIEQVSAERWDNLDIDLIRRARDPWTCPEHLLNFLAYERSVDIWNENWPVQKKRSVIASAPADHRIIGSKGPRLACAAIWKSQVPS